MSTTIVALFGVVAVVAAVKLTNWSFFFRMIFRPLCKAYLFGVGSGLALAIAFSIYVI